MHYLDLPIWKQFFFTCGDYLLSNLILFLWLRSLFYSLPAKQLFQKLPTLLFLAPVEAAFNWNAAKIIQNAPLMWLIYVLIALFFTLFSMWVWHRPFWHCLAAVCIAEMMESSLSVVFIDVLYACFPMLFPNPTPEANLLLCIFLQIKLEMDL